MAASQKERPTSSLTIRFCVLVSGLVEFLKGLRACRKDRSIILPF